MQGRSTAVSIIAAAAATLSMAGCARQELATGTPLPDGHRAVAMLRTADGRDAGHASVTEVAGGLRVAVDVRGLPPGMHGAHLHMVGQCEAPGFITAGGHWNPGARAHGTMNPRGPHAGDLPNLIVGNDGRGTVAATLPGVTMAQLLDADGAAMVIHAEPDDLMTDPAGNSGARIACGVLQPA